jgi:group I intron endonuclease
LNNLHIRTTFLSYRKLLNQKSGVYAFINLINGKRYIGSGINLYRRFLVHIVGRSSNILLQRAFKKYGLNNFEFVIYAYSDYDLSLIIDLENKFISSFPFTMLYKLTPAAGSMFGYKHSAESIIKMEELFKDKNNHPMFGKNSIEAKELISKPGAEHLILCLVKVILLKHEKKCQIVKAHL